MWKTMMLLQVVCFFRNRDGFDMNSCYEYLHWEIEFDGTCNSVVMVAIESGLVFEIFSRWWWIVRSSSGLIEHQIIENQVKVRQTDNLKCQKTQYLIKKTKKKTRNRISRIITNITIYAASVHDECIACCFTFSRPPRTKTADFQMTGQELFSYLLGKIWFSIPF